MQDGRKRRRLRRAVRWVLAAAVSFVLAVSAWTLVHPDVPAMARRNPKYTAFIERYRDRNPDAPLHWTWVQYESISPHLRRAVLVGEDINFFTHHGFELREIGRALGEAWDERELPRGASTITQQVAKNLWLSPSWNPVRKLREAILTWRLEKRLTKRRILELYLNVAEFGPGIYGAEAAARRYFGKSAAELDAFEAAQIAAGLPKPSLWHPGSRSRTYARRVRTLQRRMDKAGFLWRQI
jgi:monofunctional biosynthetic peptidoglycan transglycosylase